ncbi:hypothetical protein MMC30_009398 [Trapelia coarctata]|nr:hypothetical protein [Trapelia coarctata]
MADALTVVGLAASILLMIQSGTKLVSMASKVALSPHALVTMIENVVQMRETIESLRSSSLKPEELTSTSTDLNDLALECEAIASELVEALKKREVQGDRRKWKNFRQQMKMTWRSQELKALAMRLQKCRERLTMYILVSFRENADIRAAIEDKRFDSLGEETQQIIKAWDYVNPKLSRLRIMTREQEVQSLGVHVKADPPPAQAKFSEDEYSFGNLGWVTISPLAPDAKALRVRAALDTGSDVNAISLKYAQTAEWSWDEPPSIQLATPLGYISVEGQIVLRVQVGTEATTIQVPFLILAEAPFDVLLGYPFIAKAGLLNRNLRSLPVLDDNQSQASEGLSGFTLGPEDDPDFLAAVDAAVANAAHVLSYEKHARELHVAAVVRLGGAAFEQNLLLLLGQFVRDLSASAKSSSEKGAAWLLRRKTRAVAHAIREEFAPEDDSKREALANLGSEPSVQMERLRQFLDEQVSGISVPAPSSPSKPDIEGESFLFQDEEPEYDDSVDLDSFKAFGSIDHLRDQLTSAEPYLRFRERYQGFVFPRPRNVIDKVLGAHLTADRPFQRVQCRIKCEIVEYLKEAFGDVQDFGSIMTITGDPSNAILTTASQYLKETWDTGERMCDALGAFLSGEASGFVKLGRDHQILFFSEPDDQDMLLITLEGSISQLAESIEQLAWVSATFRKPLLDGLTVSEIDFGYTGTKSSPNFYLSLLRPSSSFPIDANEPGQCWTLLFSRSILAYGFPVSGQRRPAGMLGLELPFEVMTTFAGIKFPILVGDSILLAGDVTLLVPGMRTDEAVQWHYLSGEDRFERLGAFAKSLDDKTQEIFAATGDSIDQELEMETLASRTAFLGYCRKAVVQLGTQGLTATTIENSGVKPVGPALEIQKVGSVSVGFSKYATGQIGSRMRWSSREARMTARDTIHDDDRFQRASDTPTLLYDDGVKRAWLVSELSLALHMTHAYLETKSLGLYQRLKIPVAREASNGGEAALKAVQKGKGLLIPLRAGNPRHFPEIVDEFCGRLEERRNQRKQTAEVWKAMDKIPWRDELRGWDFADLKDGILRERVLKGSVLGRGSPIWWKLFQNREFVVIFGRNIGCPIQSFPGLFEPCCVSWDDVPIGEDVMVASLPCLQRLRRILCSGKEEYRGQVMLSNNVAWARPEGSRLFEICTPMQQCNPVQGLQMVFEGPLWRVQDGCLPPPTNLEPGGAVMFADRPNTFPFRACQVRDPPSIFRMSSKTVKDYWKHDFRPAHLVVLFLALYCLEPFFRPINGVQPAFGGGLNGMGAQKQLNSGTRQFDLRNHEL